MCLSKYVNKWRDINAPEHVVQWISEGVRILFDGVVDLQVKQSNHHLSATQSEFVDKEITDLVNAGSLVEVDTPPACVVPIGCVPKKNNKYRLITDLRSVNSACRVPKCRYEDVSMLKDIVKKDDCFVSLDLKDGFFHIPVHEDDRKYLGICWKGKYYTWTVTPFGLSVSPYYFCKTLRPVIQHLRSLGIRILAFMDDIIIAASRDLIDKHAQICIDTLLSLGWKINWEKSSIVPSTEIEYLGYVINSCGPEGVPQLRVPQSKIRKVKKDIKRALKNNCVSARILARLAGQCIAMCRAVLPGKLQLRRVYSLLSTRTSWDDKLTWSDGAISDFSWWLNAVDSWNGTSLIPTVIDGQLETDASHIGWGAVYNNQYAQGSWNQSIANRSSNFRELLTVLFALHSFRPRNQTIQILSDNVTTVAYLNHMGGPSLKLTEIAKAIWSECLKNKIMLVARHLPGKYNVTADGLSRYQDKYEWFLHPRLFGYLDRMWGPHTCDRFASMTTTQLPVYNSRFLDPLTSGVDALAQVDWQAHNNFVNAPFRLLPAVLDTISQQRAPATIIAPWWPSQPWFHRLKSMVSVPPLEIPNNSNTCRRMGMLPEPLRNRKWRLFAWRVCGSRDC